MTEFEISFLDHVALRVKNIDASAIWYEKILGLEMHSYPKWGEFPVFMLANKTGIALFPANLNDTQLDQTSNNIKIDHFAFNVTIENFEKAMIRFDELGLDYEFNDYHYVKSIFTKDPDGHLVEITTVLLENEFYTS